MLLTILSSFLLFGDLEDRTQDFVLETKKIEIPGYPTAFNPAIFRWNDYLVLMFRTRHPETGNTSHNRYVFLDEEFNPISDSKPLQINFKETQKYDKVQDPRFICVNNEYYAVFNNQIGMAGNREIRRMFVGKLNEELVCEEAECLDTPKENTQEKNWAPFEYNGELLLSHSLDPHLVLRNGEIVAESPTPNQWIWGELRGGTPALLDGDHYLAFFHSSVTMATANSDGKNMTHYFMGAYTFSKEPPFEITAISPEPIVGKNFYNGPIHNTWKPLRVVFPCGFVFDENYIWISYGRQDHEIWIVKLDKRGLLNSLIQIP